MVLRKVTFFLVIACLVFLSSCAINSNLILRTPKDFAGYDSIPLKPVYEHKISPDDLLQVRIFTNDAMLLLDRASGTNSMGIDNGMNTAVGAVGAGGARMMGTVQIDFLVKKDGNVELPFLGDVPLGGMTIQKAQDTLRELYRKQYIDPLIRINISNQRVIVFNGSGATGTILPITDTKTTLLEILVKAGGVNQRGRAKYIQIMRQTPEGRQIYLVDLSTIEGLYYADMVVQANDIIYVRPLRQLDREVFRVITPVLSAFTGGYFLYNIVERFINKD
jgi:polysaccharide biosynthesis/export protein